MSEETTENLPVSWQEQMKADAKAMLENERPAMAIMSLKSGQMTIGGEAVPGNEIDCVILASVTEMAWYKDRYDPDVRANPSCYAIGEGKAEELKPYAESEMKQAEACVECGKFEWGSDPNGGRGKACKERRKMVVIPANGSADQVLLSIPPTSLKNWANYAREIIIETGMTPICVVTKIKVVPDPKNQFVVKFTKVSDVPEHMLAQLQAKRSAALEVLTAPYPPIEEEEAPKDKKKRKF
jgi:hypothetical protein